MLGKAEEWDIDELPTLLVSACTSGHKMDTIGEKNSVETAECLKRW